MVISDLKNKFVYFILFTYLCDTIKNKPNNTNNMAYKIVDTQYGEMEVCEVIADIDGTNLEEAIEIRSINDGTIIELFGQSFEQLIQDPIRLEELYELHLSNQK